MSTTSNSANFYLQFSNYFDVDTFLNFTYNSTLIQISAGSSTAYSVLANSQGSIVLSRWAAVTTTSRFISPFTIVNPPAAITFSLTAILSFVLDAVAYNIQSFTASFQLVPLAFLTLSFSPSFQYGRTDNSFGISNICA